MATETTEKRIEFDDDTKLYLAGRVGYRCSNPNCRRLTIGPKKESREAIKLGDAAHILPARRNGPRGGKDLPVELVRDQDNGLWLCPACHRLVDRDPAGYPEALLRGWKAQAEKAASQEIEGVKLNDPPGSGSAPAPSIFICYSHEDEEFVLKLNADLQIAGVAPWIFQTEIQARENWPKSIVQAIKECAAFIVALSPDAAASDNVMKELVLANQYKKKIIPLQYQVAVLAEEMEYILAGKQYQDFTRGEYGENLARLVKVLPRPAAASPASRPAAPQSSPEGTAEHQPTVAASQPADSIAGKPVELKVKTSPPTAAQTTDRSQAKPPKEASPPGDLKPARVVKITSPIEMDFLLVEKGPFLMGSRPDNPQAYEDEKPQHTVDLAYDYWIGRTLVTNRQFREFWDARKTQHMWVSDWQKKLDHPVVNVSWDEAQDFCQWLNGSASQALPAGYRFCLPSEAEWEKAARGTDGREWPWGGEWDAKRCNTSEAGIKTTTPVGKYSPGGDSPCGAADMAGNAWEWTRSLWGKDGQEPDYVYPYDASDGRENEQAGGIYRVVRGGSWGYLVQRNTRCAYRYRFIPSLFHDLLGFRVVLSLARPGS